MTSSARPWGEPAWHRPRLRQHPPEAGPFDVVIVGAGLTGVSTAYHLAKRGARALVLEAGALGNGASGRCGGIVLEGTAAGSLAEADSCIAGLERLVRTEQIDCDLILNGCWEIQHGTHGEGGALPWTDEGYAVAVARTVAGGSVEPGLLLMGLADAAVRLGASLLEHTLVKRLVVEGAPALELEGGATLRPGTVVVAVNAWLNSLVTIPRHVRSALTFACATEPLDRPTLDEIGLGPGLPFYTVDVPYLWGVVRAQGNLIFGSGLVFGEVSELEARDVGRNKTAVVLDRLEARVRALHPRLSQVRFGPRWAGPIAFTSDFVPLLGRLPACSHVLVAGAYAGHGVALSVRAGELLAQAIADDQPLPAWGSLIS